MSTVTFFQQLRHRRMFRIVVGYAAVGWIGLQATDQLINRGLLPEFAYPLALIWYLAGIPIAIVLGWFHGEKGQQKFTRLEITLLLCIVAGGLVASAPTVSGEITRRMQLAALEAALDVRRVAVLYFQDATVGGDAQHLADGFTESLIDELATVRELDVISRHGVGRFRDNHIPPDSVGKVLEAGTLVDGAVEQVGSKVRISVRLIDGQSGAQFQRVSIERPIDDLLRARDEVVETTAALLREWMGEEVRLRRTRRGTGNVAAWALYHRGERSVKDAEAALQRGDRQAMITAFVTADSLLAQVEVLDPQWIDPAILRGHIAFRRARVAQSRQDLLDQVRVGLEHTGRALRLEPNNARALEVRGTLYYWHFLQDIEDHDSQADLLHRARQDLERSVQLNPSLASAHASLAHLYLNRGDEPAAVLAGRRAYEEDAWLDNADVVIFRVFSGSYNLEQFVEARRWCRIGQRRFPEDHRFVACELLLLTTPELEPDIDRAWALLERLKALAPEHQAEWEGLRGELLVGGVIARAGIPDSARAVWDRVRPRITPQLDPRQWLIRQEAYLRTFVGDFDEAIDLLKLYMVADPGASFEHHWWWRELRRHPRYAEIAIDTHH